MRDYLEHAGFRAVPAVDDERVRRVGPRGGQGLAKLLQAGPGSPEKIIVAFYRCSGSWYV